MIESLTHWWTVFFEQYFPLTDVGRRKGSVLIGHTAQVEEYILRPSWNRHQRFPLTDRKRNKIGQVRVRQFDESVARWSVCEPVCWTGGLASAEKKKSHHIPQHAPVPVSPGTVGSGPLFAVGRPSGPGAGGLRPC